MKTLLLVKPDAVQAQKTGPIITRLEQEGFVIIGLKKLLMTNNLADDFYEEHRGKPFFNDLVAFMTSGPLVGVLLEKNEAIPKLRTLLGATDPSQAAPGTLRAEFGTSLRHNAVHASDTAEHARHEITLIFPEHPLN